MILSINDFEKIQEQLEDLEDLRAYDRVKARNESFVSLDEYRSKRRMSVGKPAGQLPEAENKPAN